MPYPPWMPATGTIDNVYLRKWTLLFVLSTERDDVVVHLVLLQLFDVIVDICFGEGREVGGKVENTHFGNLGCDETEELGQCTKWAGKSTSGL